jgi:hypothetical protein
MVLRTTFKDGQILFEDLGDKFTLNTDRSSPERFKQFITGYFKGTGGDNMDCYGFVSIMRMNTFDIPLYADHKYSVLSERGCETMRIESNGIY